MANLWGQPFGSLTDLGLKRAVAELGLDPEKDIKMIQTGGVPENLLFMQQGVIKGGLISSPTLEKAKELGYREFMNLANLKYRYPGTALVTTDSFIRSRPQTVSRFLKATLEGIKYAKANPDFTIRVLGKYTRTADTSSLPARSKVHSRLHPRYPHSNARGNGGRHGGYRHAQSQSQRRRRAPVLRPRAAGAVGKGRVYQRAVSMVAF